MYLEYIMTKEEKIIILSEISADLREVSHSYLKEKKIQYIESLIRDLKYKK